MNGTDAAAKINAIEGKGWKFSIDFDTRLSSGMQRRSKKDIVAHLNDARADWTYRVVVLKNEGRVLVTESRR